MIRLLIEMQMEAATIAAMAVLTLLFGLMAGHRAHFWLWFYSPWVQRRVPADTGAWLGLMLAAGFLLL